ncbi:hypothetical protein ZHAS_00007539 [Anopheles sinensis]|uniref:Uncharacterized protein n=1 Tax=Anopheles sinensis TaxID=74873 RepID=A0A084VQ33_ANOSI|nr:hypothetical protein ZHAS_00007539 [Anopheles sinensis]
MSSNEFHRESLRVALRSSNFSSELAKANEDVDAVDGAEELMQLNFSIRRLPALTGRHCCERLPIHRQLFQASGDSPNVDQGSTGFESTRDGLAVNSQSSAGLGAQLVQPPTLARGRMHRKPNGCKQIHFKPGVDPVDLYPSSSLHPAPPQPRGSVAVRVPGHSGRECFISIQQHFKSAAKEP